MTKPWHNSPKKKGTVPPEGPEQAQALHSTRTVSNNVIPVISAIPVLSMYTYISLNDSTIRVVVALRFNT